ncbi:MAG: hypothetical protein RBR28_03590 [Lentimicrobium sp.]|jgi:hypothetical protein|nr:hypothetical protein [Lentimicrobium sp.]
MKRNLLFIAFLIAGKMLFAQFSVGTGITAAFPTQSNQLDYDFGIGGAIHLGYEPNDAIKFKLNYERQWVSSFKEKNRINLMYGEVLYSFTKWETRPFVGFGAGYAIESFEPPLDFGTQHYDGLMLSPAIGFISQVNFIKNLSIEAKLSYDFYFLHNTIDVLKGSVGLVYKFRKAG